MHFQLEFSGDISTKTLVNDAPFCDYDLVDMFGQSLIYVRNYVENLHNVIVA